MELGFMALNSVQNAISILNHRLDECACHEGLITCSQNPGLTVGGNQLLMAATDRGECLY